MSTQKPMTDTHSREDMVDLCGEPVVVNLGCGTDDRGVGIDIHYQPDIEHDLNDGIPLDDGSVDKLLCEHVLEHLDNPTQLLCESQRVLRDDGTLELALPNVSWLPVRLWLSQDQHRFWSHKNPQKDGHWLARKLGNEEEERTAHRSLWTPALLEEHLERAGFDYEIEGSHFRRNFRATATPQVENESGKTLHELERETSRDMAAGDYWAQTRARIMVQWVDRHDPDTVLDIGCGSGYLTERIAENPSRSVTGIDASNESIEAAQRRNTSADFRVGDAFGLDVATDAVDCVIFGDVLEHLENPADALLEAKRVLSSDGVMIVSVPAYRWLYGPHDEHNGHYDRYNANRLGELASEAGCQLQNHRYTNLVPLLPYAVYQKILGKQVPTGARGNHSGWVEWLKQRAIDAEVKVKSPVGITLIGEVAPE